MSRELTPGIEISRYLGPEACDLDRATFANRKAWLWLAGSACAVGLAWTALPIRFPQQFRMLVPEPFGIWMVVLAIASVLPRLAGLTPHRSDPTAVRFLAAAVSLLVPWVFPTGSALVLHWVVVASAAAAMAILGGSAWLRLICPPLVILTLVPLLSYVEEPVVSALQAIATQFALLFSHLMLSDDYVRLGQQVVLPFEGGGFEVARECSGYRSMFAMILLATFFCLHPVLTFRLRIGILLAALALSTAGNFVRIGATIALYQHGHTQLVSGSAHEFMGVAVLAVEVAALYFLFNWARRSGPSRKGSR